MAVLDLPQLCVLQTAGDDQYIHVISAATEALP
jgi:hypothetical protein